MEQKTNKVGIKGWLALLVLCIMFSGVLKNVEGPLKALDFSNLVGAWGKIGESGQNFIGKGGTGAREGMMQAFAKQNITTVTGRKVVSISEDGVTVADKNNETTVIASDSVVYAIGMRPNNHLVDELRDSAPFVRAVGDCVRARKVSPAIYEAYYAAVNL